MPIPAKYAGHCKDCEKEFKAGEQIERNDNQNWCGLGKKCPLKSVNTPATEEEKQQQQEVNQQQKLDSMVNDKTPEMTATAIRRILKACWKLSFEDACEALKGASGNDQAGWKETLILAQVFFKEYSAHYRSLIGAHA